MSVDGTGETETHKSLNMSGYKVHIPANIVPYKTQMLMMVKILNALKTSENAMVESPTGSGKTLALLAATCSWLANYKIERPTSRIKCEACRSKRDMSLNTTATDSILTALDKMETSVNLSATADLSELEFGLDETSNQSTENFANESIMSEASTSGTTTQEMKHTCLPLTRIYYCTRTHKQIAQVVKEYKRLPFHNKYGLRHTILASREQTCINEDVRNKGGDLNGNCKEKIGRNGKGCEYRNNLKGLQAMSARYKLQDKDINAWDIEELLEKLPTVFRSQICPYFLATRELTKDADIIFCPFNYLIDPIIRESSDVHIKNSIVILDEAHNIEDSCRSAASFDLTDKDLLLTMRQIIDHLHQFKESAASGVLSDANEADVSELKNFEDSLKLWHDYLQKFFNLFQNLALKIQHQKTDYNRPKMLNMHAAELNDELNRNGVYLKGAEWKKLMSAFVTLSGKRKEQNAADINEVLNLQLPAGAIVFIEKILYFFYFHSDANNAEFYKGNMTIETAAPRNFHATQAQPREEIQPLIVGHLVTLRFWCMMPSVSFVESFKNSRTLILASGTLCPTDTFKTELGLAFTQSMEGDQIISKDRIFAVSLPSGPGNKQLSLTYQSMQDNSTVLELAKIIFDICRTVPKGVLCFVSSYRVLEQLTTTMNSSGIMRLILKEKEVFQEPRDSRSLSTFLADYEKSIEHPKGDRTGALMIAVFRGKVSEGLDFSDDKARCVISIGIPYASAMDEQVTQKRMFNDIKRREIDVLSGSEWYKIQAFRAINQALGRCLRHRDDWGALVLIDQRLSSREQMISKWVRKNMRQFTSYDQCLQTLKEFVENFKNCPNKENDDLVIMPNDENDDLEIIAEVPKVQVPNIPTKKRRNPLFT